MTRFVLRINMVVTRLELIKLIASYCNITFPISKKKKFVMLLIKYLREGKHRLDQMEKPVFFLLNQSTSNPL